MARRDLAPERVVRLDCDPGDEVLSGFILFGTRQINLHRLALVEQLNYSYLYRVFRGKRIPSIVYARRIAARLGMSVDEFYRALPTDN